MLFVYSIYIVKLVFEWVKSLGGVDVMEKVNCEKLGFFYDYIDFLEFYSNFVRDKKSCFLCNIFFIIINKDLDEKFVKEVIECGFKNIKGYCLVGGMRVSFYNVFFK